MPRSLVLTVLPAVRQPPINIIGVRRRAQGRSTPRPVSRPQLRWSADDAFEIDGVRYVCRPFRDPFPTKDGTFCLRKPREEIERYVDLIDGEHPERIFEIGIYQGGSTAMLAQIARPEKLIAIELASKPVRGLEQLIDERGMRGSVSPHWGVDQGDLEKLTEIATTELGDAPLDLVIDDGSHYLEESRATLNVLLPRLRPGGLYLLEDWSWAHAAINIWPERRPLTSLVFELVVASGHSPGLIADVRIDRAWTLVRRGDAILDPRGFDLGDYIGERGTRLLKDLDAAGVTPTGD